MDLWLFAPKLNKARQLPMHFIWGTASLDFSVKKWGSYVLASGWPELPLVAWLVHSRQPHYDENVAPVTMLWSQTFFVLWVKGTCGASLLSVVLQPSEAADGDVKRNRLRVDAEVYVSPTMHVTQPSVWTASYAGTLSDVRSRQPCPGQVREGYPKFQRLGILSMDGLGEMFVQSRHPEAEYKNGRMKMPVISIDIKQTTQTWQWLVGGQSKTSPRVQPVLAVAAIEVIHKKGELASGYFPATTTSHSNSFLTRRQSPIRAEAKWANRQNDYYSESWAPGRLLSRLRILQRLARNAKILSSFLLIALLCGQSYENRGGENKS
ncbi:hypothetical protein V8F20_003787 [Naviculisporaceae sp. PSN 640]